MPATNRFGDTFAALRALLEPHAKRMTVTVDEPTRYELASPTMTDRIGRPLYCAGVRVNKTSVSFHLIPLYMDPTLRESLSPALRKRMHGQSCLNFTSVDAAELKELSAITKKGIAGFQHLKLPWA